MCIKSAQDVFKVAAEILSEGEVLRLFEEAGLSNPKELMNNVKFLKYVFDELRKRATLALRLPRPATCAEVDGWIATLTKEELRHILYQILKKYAEEMVRRS